MVATTRPSAPKSSAIATIADAAPGEVPQAAVLAWIPPKRTIASPTTELRITVRTVANSIRCQESTIASSTARVIEWAASKPMQPWPRRKACR